MARSSCTRHDLDHAIGAALVSPLLQTGCGRQGDRHDLRPGPGGIADRHGHALSLHSDLQRLGVPAGFLHFPSEGHTIGAPNHIRIMYETVLSFLDHHVLGKEWSGRTCTR
ncbi:prolyl oligopeptidase family serine peptidase [Streptomyces sp. NPDC088760]|uniref:prolyl oligopeptidase family serine peptidase n=1 Tax=Streptomyces sp. NPDC088760 TaxID=3365890 RepID=UPI003821AAA1